MFKIVGCELYTDGDLELKIGGSLDSSSKMPLCKPLDMNSGDLYAGFIS